MKKQGRETSPTNKIPFCLLVVNRETVEKQ